MESSIRLFDVRGIAIRMHITFPLILIWAALQFGLLSGHGWRGAAFGIVVTLLLFVIVVLHELGHSFAALSYGVPVKQVVLLPIGGVAQLGNIPDKPAQEFVIAIAGPLVNFGLAIVLAALGIALGQQLGAGQMLATLEGLGRADLSSVFVYVFASNLFLGIFNLLPAFPMDGGRVLRALLASRLEYTRATGIAVAVGRSLAWLLGLWGFLNGGFFLILIAVFIYVGAGQEGQLVQVRSVLGGLKVVQAYSRDLQSLSRQSTLREAIDLTLSTVQSDFPVCDGERLVGLLPQGRLVEALHRYGPDVPVGEVMLTDVAPVAPGEALFTVQQRLAESKWDAVPVVEGGRFLGLLTSREINEVYRLVSSRPGVMSAARSG